MKRYGQLLELIDQFKPQSIIEIGVWNGANAIRMIKQAAKHHPKIHYIGYDLFTEATPETDEREFNVKSHNHRLNVLMQMREAVGADHRIELIQGDTRQTLKPSVADFVFIDGGHSVETIKSDYEALKDSRIVVLDDFYRDGPDINRYGCNSLTTEILDRQLKLLPIADPVKGGGTTQLVLVEKQ